MPVLTCFNTFLIIVWEFIPRRSRQIEYGLSGDVQGVLLVAGNDLDMKVAELQGISGLGR